MGPFKRARGASLSTVPPSIDTADYSPKYATIAASILYKSPLPSQNDLPVFILNSAAFPDANDIVYDSLLPYVLARLPSDEQLIGGKGYEVVFFAGGEDRASENLKKARPGLSWFMQVYSILSRAMRKRLQKLYLVHERRWIRVMIEMFSTVVSPKFRRKIVHATTLSALALHIPLEDLLIPPSAYDRDRKLSLDIYVPYASGKRAFGVSNPLPLAADGNLRLPRVLRETTSFVLMLANIRTEGLFRVNSRAITTEVLKEAYDRGQKFILWKDPPAVLAPVHFKEGHGDITIDELDPLEGYSVHNAAGLIKMWYSSLRESIFPPSSYAFISRVFGGNEPEPIETPLFLDLILQSADYSPLTRTSRRILTMHLFPLLSRIAADSEENKMTPKNLATCFAPSLLCGPDPVEDFKMSAVISRILEFGITCWNDGIAEKCSMAGTVFEDSLMTPKNPSDREDSLDSQHSEPERRDTGGGEQTEGITMLENSSESDVGEELTHQDPRPHDDDNADSQADGNGDPAPPLPPRVASFNSPTSPTSTSQQHALQATQDTQPAKTSPTTANFNDPVVVRRKPAPPLQQPPRYSIIVGPSGVERHVLDTNVPLDTNPGIISPDGHVADGFRRQGFGTPTGDGLRSAAGSQRLPRYTEFADDGVPFVDSPTVSRSSTMVGSLDRKPGRSSLSKSVDGESLSSQLIGEIESAENEIKGQEQAQNSTTVNTAAPAAEPQLIDTSDTSAPAATDSAPQRSSTHGDDLMDFSPTSLNHQGTGMSTSSSGSAVQRKPVGGGK